MQSINYVTGRYMKEEREKAQRINGNIEAIREKFNDMDAETKSRALATIQHLRSQLK